LGLLGSSPTTHATQARAASLATVAWAVPLLVALAKVVADAIAVFVDKAAPRCVSAIVADTITILIDKTLSLIPTTINGVVTDTIIVSIGEAESTTTARVVVTNTVTVFIDKTLPLTAGKGAGSFKRIYPVSEATCTISHLAPLATLTHLQSSARIVFKHILLEPAVYRPVGHCQGNHNNGCDHQRYSHNTCNYHPFLGIHDLWLLKDH
jgi:hypothetical protein